MKKTVIIALITCIVLPVIMSACKTAHEHTYSSEITSQPTCTTAGIRTYTCTICKDTYTEEIPMTEHEYEEETTKEATCTENGIKTYICSVCGESYEEEIPAAGHKYKKTVMREPTCTQKGLIQKECERCGKIVKSTTDMAEHTWVEATCTEPKHCSVCGTTEGEAPGHDLDSSGKCVRCGETPTIINLNIKNSLPKEITRNKRPAIRITGFTYKTSSFYDLIIYFEGECISVNTDTGIYYIKYQILGPDGYVVASGIRSTPSIAHGEKFRNCEEHIHFTKPLVADGTYTLVLVDDVP